MRPALSMLTLCFVALACRPSALAQEPSGCYTAVTYTQCVPPEGSCSTYMNTAKPTTYGADYVWVQAPCCGYEVWVPVQFIGECYSTELRDPDTVNRLAVLSKTTNVLIASCDGYIRHLLPQTPVATRLWQWRTTPLDGFSIRDDQLPPRGDR